MLAVPRYYIPGPFVKSEMRGFMQMKAVEIAKDIVPHASRKQHPYEPGMQGIVQIDHGAADFA